MSDDTKILSESMKLRNTDTSALKRMPVMNAASESSSAARKTIKLKPLAPRSGNDQSTPTTTASLSNIPSMKPLGTASSASVSAPSMMLDEKQKSTDQETRVPQFMSTATTPVAQIPKPGPSLAASMAAELKRSPSASPVQTINLKNALGAVATASKIIPPISTTTTAVPRISQVKTPSVPPTGTVSMPRFNEHTKPVAPPPSPSAAPVQTTTSFIPKYVATPTGSIPRISSGNASKVSDATSPIPKITLSKASAPTVADPLKTNVLSPVETQSELGDQKPAIKVRPSGNMSGPVPVAAPSAQTIKLTHKMDSTVAPMPSASAGAPTIQLSQITATKQESPETLTLTHDNPEANNAAAPSEQGNNSKEVTVTTKIPRKIGFKKPSLPGQSADPKAGTAAAQPSNLNSLSSGPASTAGIRMQDDIANKQTMFVNDESEQTIELNNTTNEADEIEKKNREALLKAAEAAAKAKANAEKLSAAEEPSLLFTITSIAALVFICFTTYAIISQYFNTWHETKVPVVIFQQLSGISDKK